MTAPARSIEHLLAEAIRRVNAGERASAKALCVDAVRTSSAHPAIHQMLALLCLQDGEIMQARDHIATSLVLRPEHPPSLLVAGDAARAAGDLAAALQFHQRAQAGMPERADAAYALGLTQHACGLLREAQRSLGIATAQSAEHVEAWFHLALVRQDLGDFHGAAQALQRVLALAPQRAEAEVNLGIVWQEAGRLDDAMRAYGRAYRLREDSFGRIAHALAAAPCGRLWLDLDALRDALRENALTQSLRVFWGVTEQRVKTSPI